MQPAGTRRRARGSPRGRQLDPVASREVDDLLAGLPPRRDLLVESLHRLQDACGYLSARHLCALAQRLRLPMAAVYEAASFYAHFDVVADGEQPPPPVTIRVCRSLPCHLAGATALQEALAAGADPARIRVVAVPCMGRCHEAPVAAAGRNHLGRTSAVEVMTAIANGQLTPAETAWPRLETYRSQGGHTLLDALRTGLLSPGALCESLAEAGLRGLGGAGFPTARKWHAVLAAPAPRYVVINADESEPGTFKDRYYLQRAPHQVLEGALASAEAVKADRVYLYLRDEYPTVHALLLEAIGELEAAGLTPPGFIVLRRGAGAYVCGEESALIESLEGKPGKPRHRPPYVAERGLFGRPTLVNNVETVYWIPEIHRRGAPWFAAQGRHGHKGLRAYSVSGRVAQPGVYVAPVGITLTELLEEYCGGMAPGHRLMAYLPGGAAGGILPASLADVPLDFETLQPHGCFIGSAGIIVLSEKDDLREAVSNLAGFFRDESCGRCTPCRVGTTKLLALLQRDEWDEAQVKALSRIMVDASICGLGQTAPNPVLSALRHFGDRLGHDGVRITSGGGSR